MFHPADQQQTTCVAAVQIPGLQQAGFRVIAPDLRGYGDTEPKPDAADSYTIDSLVEDVAGNCSADETAPTLTRQP